MGFLTPAGAGRKADRFLPLSCGGWVALILTLLVFFLSWPLPVRAQNFTEADAQGTEKSLTVSGADQYAFFYYISRGNISSPVSLVLKGPDGITAELWATPIKGSAEATLRSTSGWYQIETDKKLALPASASAVTAAAQLTCDDLAPIVYQQYAAVLQMYLGRPPTRDEVCKYFLNGSGGTTPTPAPTGAPAGTPTPVPPGYPTPVPTIATHTSSLVTRAFVHKNTCTSSRTNYLVLLKVFTNGASGTISASFMQPKRYNRMAATIKPVSDGKYAPQPLLLMTSNGWSYNQKEAIDIYRWRAKGPSRLKRIYPKDYVYYRGLRLTRALIGPVLRGGKATVEISNGTSGYSVCFTLVRKRQSVNGYPKG